MKLKRAKTTIFFLLILGMLAYLSPKHAVSQDTGLRISRLNVSVWPEYDDPRVLVIYHGEFEEGPNFPLWADFYIPEDAEINGAGIDAPDGQQLWQEYKIIRQGDRKAISVNLNQSRFFLEYYYDPFPGGALKYFEQKIENKYPVADLRVTIQKPLKAEDFQITPKTEDSFTDTRGFTYFRYNFTNLQPENSVNLMVSYKKDDPDPSIVRQKSLQQGAERPAPSQGQKTASGFKGGSSERAYAGIVLIIVAGVIAAVIIIKKVSSGEEEPIDIEERRAEGRGGWNFCPACGAKLEKNYKFCPACGHTIKRGT
jgi:hypothetical protein